MRKSILPFAIGLVISLSLSTYAAAYSGGSGTAGNPYQIADVNDLLALGANTVDYGKCFILTADVNLQGQVFTTAIIAPDTSSSSGFQGTAFTGTFDGNGQKITHFTINGGSNAYLGLFGYIGFGGQVKNLGLENCAVSGSCAFLGSYEVGGLVGGNGGSISHCYSTGAVSGGSSVGGLVGGSIGSISNCYSTGAVSGSVGVGGLVGSQDSGTITDCYSTGSVISSSSYFTYAGGLVGSQRSGGTEIQRQYHQQLFSYHQRAK